MSNQNFCAPQVGPGRVQSYLKELLQLSPEDVRGVLIGLQATLSSTVPSTDTYRVPADQELIVYSMQGYLRFPTLNTEAQTILGYLNLDPSERWFVKTQNCLVKLENTDRSQNVMDLREIPLSAISPPVGAPVFFPVEAPFVVPAGHNLRGTFTLQDSTSAIVSNATVYGVLLSGVLIPKLGRR